MAPSFRRKSSCLPIVLGIVGFGASVRATSSPEGPLSPAVLRYERHGAASACPDEEAFRGAVAGRLGYQPFANEGRLQANVRLDGTDKQLRATIELQDWSGKRVGYRVLTAPGPQCTELASVATLGLSIAIDAVSSNLIAASSAPPIPPPPRPDPVTRPPPVPTPIPPATAAPRPAELLPTQDPVAPWLWTAKLGPVASWGMAPATAWGAAISVSAQRAHTSIALEGLGYRPTSGQVAGQASVETYLLGASLGACLHGLDTRRSGHSAFSPYGCIGGSLGALEGTSWGVDQRFRKATAFSTAGGRVGMQLRGWGVFGIDAHFDLSGVLTPTVLKIDGQEVWTTGSVIASTGVQATMDF